MTLHGGPPHDVRPRAALRAHLATPHLRPDGGLTEVHVPAGTSREELEREHRRLHPVPVAGRHV